jgi:hypothetical protein
MTFRGAEQRFLLLFLEKEEYCDQGNTVTRILLGGNPPEKASLSKLTGYSSPSGHISASCRAVHSRTMSQFPRVAPILDLNR